MFNFTLLFAQAVILVYALVGGVFMAFSDFIMRALIRTSGTGGAEAMHVINREVFRWVFMVLFIGLAPASLGMALYGLIFIGGAAGLILAIAGLIYLIGCFGVTVCFNVPLNNRLARMSLSDPEANSFWQKTYVPRWTLWNTVRGLACVLSAVLMLSALPRLVSMAHL